ncbi:hypothetical protein K458DRAFT_407864 [Lentithecium fluviatile CBS 122367]|uniref:Uncharacterized protein n=1 Tax=Lentithecium fluviatile CBS 122367 TaxID=1168545 RepID=A0A6G1IPF7_9PLEO|nr:hypothetical protein K458DRAFT_407864 [Lentithecium fluviatile CBS 122367]
MSTPPSPSPSYASITSFTSTPTTLLKFPTHLPPRPTAHSRLKPLISNRYIQALLLVVGTLGLIALVLFIGTAIGKVPDSYSGTWPNSQGVKSPAAITTLLSTTTVYTTVAVVASTVTPEMATKTRLVTGVRAIPSGVAEATVFESTTVVVSTTMMSSS